MKYFCIALLCFSAALAQPAKPVEFTLESQLKTLAPEWTVAVKAEGDMNFNDLPDFALILVKDNQKEKKQVTFRLYYGDGRGKLYELRSEHPEAVCLLCGGMKGGEIPFRLAIKNNVLYFTHFGGTRDGDEFEITTEWTMRKFDYALVRFTQKLIDSTAEVGDISLIERSVDVLNAKVAETVKTVEEVTPKGKKTVDKTIECPMDKSYQKYRLRTFDLAKFTVPKCSEAKL